MKNIKEDLTEVKNIARNVEEVKNLLGSRQQSSSQCSAIVSSSLCKYKTCYVLLWMQWRCRDFWLWSITQSKNR